VELDECTHVLSQAGDDLGPAQLDAFGFDALVHKRAHQRSAAAAEVQDGTRQRPRQRQHLCVRFLRGRSVPIDVVAVQDA